MIKEGDEGFVEGGAPTSTSPQPNKPQGEFVDGEYVEADMEASQIVAEAIAEQQEPVKEMSEVMEQMREMQQLRELNAYMKEISNEDENKEGEKMREGPAQVKLNEITVQPINMQVIVPEEPPK